MTDVQGFVVRDSDRKEIVVAIRGRSVSFPKSLQQKISCAKYFINSTSAVDFLMDAQIALVPFISPGVSAPCKDNHRQC